MLRFRQKSTLNRGIVAAAILIFLRLIRDCLLLIAIVCCILENLRARASTADKNKAMCGACRLVVAFNHQVRRGRRQGEEELQALHSPRCAPTCSSKGVRRIHSATANMSPASMLSKIVGYWPFLNAWAATSQNTERACQGWAEN